MSSLRLDIPHNLGTERATQKLQAARVETLRMVRNVTELTGEVFGTPVTMTLTATDGNLAVEATYTAPFWVPHFAVEKRVRAQLQKALES